MARWNKRPSNYCRSCNYVWNPRGHDLSPRCPRCQSTEVDYAIVGCILALFTPFFALAKLLIQFVAWLIIAVVTLFRRGTPVVLDATQPAREGMASLAQKAWTQHLFAWRWLFSIKDDFAGDEDREISVYGLIAKILIWLAISVTLMVVTLKLLGFGKAH